MAGENTLDYATQAQALITVKGVPGYFATKSGGETSADTTDVWDGGKRRPSKLGGPATTENVTVSRPWSRSRDGALVKRLRQQVGVLRTTVSDQPTDAQLMPVGDPEVYTSALLVRVGGIDKDASSSDPTSFELEFAVEDSV